MYNTIMLVVLNDCETWSFEISENARIGYLRKGPETNIWSRMVCEWGVENDSQ